MGPRGRDCFFVLVGKGTAFEVLCGYFCVSGIEGGLFFNSINFGDIC